MIQLLEPDKLVRSGRDDDRFNENTVPTEVFADVPLAENRGASTSLFPLLMSEYSLYFKILWQAENSAHFRSTIASRAYVLSTRTTRRLYTSMT